MNTKKITAIILSLAVFSVLALGVVQPAKAQTALEILIENLKQRIAVLQQQLAELQRQNNLPIAWCYTFDRNLGVGSNGMAVVNLQTALNKEGLYSQSQTGVFDERLASAVVAFQQKYASEILTPLGLTNGTGYVGASTRTKLNQLYGCGTQTGPITINSISGPSVLGVNQRGIWTINVSAPDRNNLSYYVDWGDTIMPMTNMPVEDRNDLYQTATLAHTYSATGNYTITVRVTDNRGRIAVRTTTVLVTANSNQIPTINGVSGPVTLRVGQVGTWTITATDYNNSPLTYSVDWGEYRILGELAPSSVAYTQTSTFTHSYSTSGNYTITFNVRNSDGNTATSTISVSVQN